MAKSVANCVAVLVALMALVSSCSSSDKPALCSSLDDLNASIQKVKDLQAGENGLSTLQADLAAVRSDVQKVINDAKAQYAPQASQIRQDLTAVQSSIATAKSSGSVSDISAVWTNVKSLGSSVTALTDAAKSTC